MRKNLLGLLAIGGAFAYAHKKRGGDFTMASVKDTFNNLVGTAKEKLNGFTANAGLSARDTESAEASEDSAYSSGFTNGSAPGSSMRH